MLIQILLSCFLKKNSADVPNQNSFSQVCHRVRILSRHKHKESTKARNKDKKDNKLIDKIKNEQIF